MASTAETLSVFRHPVSKPDTARDTLGRTVTTALSRPLEDVRVERLRAAQARAVGTAFLRLRAWIVTPNALAAFTLSYLAGAPRRQLVGMACGMTLALGFFWFEWARARKVLVTWRWLVGSLLATLVVLGAMTALSGATSSPMFPLLFAPTVTLFAIAGRRAESLLTGAILALVLAGLALIPPGVPFPVVGQPWHRAILTLSAVTTAALLLASVAGLTDALSRQAAELDRLREDVIEESRARSRTLDAVGARVAHELKNPLTAIKGLVALTARGNTDPRHARRFEVVESEVARMEHILGDWLTFARPLEDLDRRPIDLGSVLTDVVSTLEARATATRVSLHSHGGACPMHGDARRLKAAFLNLATNALEATPPGGAVSITWACGDHNAIVHVADTGRGMSPDAIERVGAAFYTTRDEGTGLGVHIARATFEQHGGALRYESREGEGTRATVTLPTSQPTRAEAS